MRLYLYTVLSFSLLSACAGQPKLAQEQPLVLSKQERTKITDRLEDAIGPSFRHHRQGNQDPELIKWRLRSYAFNKFGPGLEAAKKDLRLLGGYDDFIELIDKTIVWRKKMQQSDAETVYQTAQEIQRKLFTIPRESFFSASRWEGFSIYLTPIIQDLWDLAGNLGHDESRVKFLHSLEYNVARSVLEDFNPKYSKYPQQRAFRFVTINQLAHQDYMPAQFDLFHRFLNGRHVEPDIAQAYYWGKRAVKNGAKIEAKVMDLGTKLTPGEIHRIRGWEEFKTLPAVQFKGILPVVLTTNKTINWISSITEKKNLATQKNIETKLSAFLEKSDQFERKNKYDLEYNILRMRRFSLSLKSAEILEFQKHLTSHEAQRDIWGLMKDALIWRSKVESLRPEAIYQTSKNLRADLESIPRELLSHFSRWYRLNEISRALSTDILKLAGKKGHAKAQQRYELIRDYQKAQGTIRYPRKMTPKSIARRTKAAQLLSTVADKNYMPAQFDLFHRFQYGGRVKPDFAAAYYWGKRALKSGAKIQKDLDAIAKKLSPDDSSRILGWGKLGAQPAMLLKK